MDAPYTVIDPKKIAEQLHVGSKTMADLLARFLMQLTQLDRVNQIYADLQHHQSLPFIQQALAHLQINYEVNAADLKRIPAKGAFVSVSNHPLGGIDGLILMDLLLQHRPDSKVMGNFLLNRLKPLESTILPVNPFEQFKAKQSSLGGLKLSLQHLKEGHPLGIFPAGEVSTYQNDARIVVDKPWSLSVAKMIAHAEVPVLPIYFEGQNSLFFHLLGTVHPLLRTARLPSELFNKAKQPIKVRIGTPIGVKDIQSFDKVSDLNIFLRSRTYALGTKLEVPKKYFSFALTKPKAIDTPQDSGRLQEEATQAFEHFPLFEQAPFKVFCAPASAIPTLLKEIGRLRELTFREVGEGTNKSTDLDGYDLYYQHLVIWDEEAKKVVGSYRICKGKLALHQYGKRGFYLSSLFKIKDEMLPILAQSMELGRSFIVKEYQRKPLSLFMLWKGIFYYLLKNPEYRYLIGPVSISKDFSRFSQSLIVQFIKQHYYDEEMAAYITPKKKFSITEDKRIDQSLLMQKLESNLNKLDAFIKDLEFGFGAPVLLKKYLKLNGKIIGFNIDPKFNNALDGLVMVDILGIDPDFIHSLSKELNDPSILERFKEGSSNN
jgi:putative hemolysin